MKASVRWLNQLVSGPALSAAEVEAVLTNAGFPIDSHESLGDGDVRLEVEVTSNRGDCLSHVGLAREVVARDPSRQLRLPAVPPVPASAPATQSLRLINEVPQLCPRFTAHVVRAVRVGPSPSWLVTILESVGQRSINNVVDVTNYISFLYGQPTHAFDLAKLAGGVLRVRFARDGETLTTLDGKKRTLRPDEVVVADERGATSLAGIMGGAESEVGASTQDVVLEAATWDAVAIRRAARRHQLRTDASHRFERGVDPRTIDEPARLAAALIAQLGNGTLASGVLDAGSPAAPLRTVSFRPARCRALMGVEVADAEIEAILARLSVEVTREATWMCRIPAFRPDLEREVDLIEEVARIYGLDQVPIRDRISVSVRPPQPTEASLRTLGGALAGLGFFEAVTFSFMTPRHAAPFLPGDHSSLAVADDRRAQDGTLRPSTLPSLLRCRRANADGAVTVEGGVRLFEMGPIFSQRSGQAAERRTLALILDVPGVERGSPGSHEDRQRGVRLLRGALEAVARTLGGDGRLTILPAAPTISAFEPGAHAQVCIDGRPVGMMGLLARQTLRDHGLDFPIAAAELDLDSLLALSGSSPRIRPLPAFPSIDRDVSLIVDEVVSWGQIDSLLSGAAIHRLEQVSFIGTYRGKQIGPGKKSVTVRMRFRDPARTLRHEEVDPEVAAVVSLAGQKLGATIRA